MVYHYRRGSRVNGLKTFGAKRRPYKRRLKPNMSKIRYQPPTARNQRGQIMANARLLARHARMIRNHRVWTDWQYAQESILENDTWAGFRLTDFPSWNAVLRQDKNTNQSTHTYVQRLVINFRASLYAASSMGLSLFIVTPRKTFASRDAVATPPVAVEEWITNGNAPGFNLRLNSNVFKVHHAKYITLTANALDVPGAAPTTMAGNPFTTYRKWQVTLPVKMKVTVPLQPSEGASSWKDTTFQMLPYYQKYQLLLYPHISQGSGQDAPYIAFDQLATCINAD